MPRARRTDHKGAWHHVMNRGIARRPVFEDRECVRYFLSTVARAVRAGDLEVHAFSIMTTHFHMLVSSPAGRLSSAMQRVQNRFVRWYNRRARRDGPLFRGRFLSRLVEDFEYRRVLVRYIDQNPVVAGMVSTPERYPHGSARYYATDRGPRWLQRGWVEQEAVFQANVSRFSFGVYREVFGVPLSPSAMQFVETRIERSASGPDPLDDLVGAAPDQVARWMRRKAMLADGTRPGAPCAPVETVMGACVRYTEMRPAWRIKRGRASIDAWSVLQVALLRDVAALGWAQLGLRVGLSESSAKRRYATHRVWMQREAEYREAVARVCGDCLNG
ncbi:MAG: REP element-mobilizing transposase RayT [Chlamydiales bacterium]|jgi:REP element-mobilizing transposase RayT